MNPPFNDCKEDKTNACPRDGTVRGRVPGLEEKEVTSCKVEVWDHHDIHCRVTRRGNRHRHRHDKALERMRG